MTLTRSFALMALTACSSAFAATDGLLPIEPGVYVRAGSACHEPPLAAMLQYDGKTFSGPHSSRCSSKLLSRDDATYDLSTTCAGNGDGTAALPETEGQRVVVDSATAIEFTHADDTATYRYCPQ